MFSDFNFLIMNFPTFVKFHLRINLLWPSIFVTELRLDSRIVFIMQATAEVVFDLVHHEELPIKHHISEMTTQVHLPLKHLVNGFILTK